MDPPGSWVNRKWKQTRLTDPIAKYRAAIGLFNELFQLDDITAVDTHLLLSGNEY
jgi:hypothetical protein